MADPRRIIVTGALGHIGSRLIRQWPSAFPAAEIVMVDNLATQRYGSLFDLPKEGRYRFVEADILDADLKGLFSGADAVIHLAALTDAAGSFDIPEKFDQVNLEGTEKVARACIAAGAPLIFPSTTSVYGTQSAEVREDCSPDELKPQSPYAEAKLRAEELLARLGVSEGLRFVICRLGTVFGTSPGMRFHTAVNKFIWQACAGTPLTVWRTALDQRRPYLDLRDTVRAFEFIVRRGLFDRQTYNVLTTHATVGEIIDQIRLQVPDLRIQCVDSPIMNQLSYVVSCEKFKALGFEFKGRLPEGIAAMVEMLGGRPRI